MSTDRWFVLILVVAAAVLMACGDGYPLLFVFGWAGCDLWNRNEDWLHLHQTKESR